MRMQNRLSERRIFTNKITRIPCRYGWTTKKPPTIDCAFNIITNTCLLRAVQLLQAIKRLGAQPMND